MSDLTRDQHVTRAKGPQDQHRDQNKDQDCLMKVSVLIPSADFLRAQLARPATGNKNNHHQSLPPPVSRRLLALYTDRTVSRQDATVYEMAPILLSAVGDVILHHHMQAPITRSSKSSHDKDGPELASSSAALDRAGKELWAEVNMVDLAGMQKQHLLEQEKKQQKGDIVVATHKSQVQAQARTAWEEDSQDSTLVYYPRDMESDMNSDMYQDGDRDSDRDSDLHFDFEPKPTGPTKQVHKLMQKHREEEAEVEEENDDIEVEAEVEAPAFPQHEQHQHQYHQNQKEQGKGKGEDVMIENLTRQLEASAAENGNLRARVKDLEAQNRRLRRAQLEDDKTTMAELREYMEREKPGCTAVLQGAKKSALKESALGVFDEVNPQPV